MNVGKHRSWNPRQTGRQAGRQAGRQVGRQDGRQAVSRTSCSTRRRTKMHPVWHRHPRNFKCDTHRNSFLASMCPPLFHSPTVSTSLCPSSGIPFVWDERHPDNLTGIQPLWPWPLVDSNSGILKNTNGRVLLKLDDKSRSSCQSDGLNPNKEGPTQSGEAFAVLVRVSRSEERS